MIQRQLCIGTLCALVIGCGGGGGGGTTPDTSAPVIASIDPPADTFGAGVNDSITVTFNEAIDPASVTASSVALQAASGGAVAATRSVNGAIVRLIPNAQLDRSAVYRVGVTAGVRDLAGNALATGTSWSFTTETDAWRDTALDANTPSGRSDHAAVWTGQEMLVWGGNTISGLTSSGACYRPAVGAAVGTWTPMAGVGAPSARSGHTAIWTGTEMIVWGGTDLLGAAATGGRYVPDSGGGTWVATTTAGAPSARSGHTATWTGSQMIVWGGSAAGLGPVADGARYTAGASGGSWDVMSVAQAPSARERHTAVWTGTELIVWGGRDSQGLAVATGARYNPSTNSWSGLSIAGAPSARFDHGAIWTGSEMIVWGGTDGGTMAATGARYNPTTNSWSPISATGAPQGRVGHTLTWTGLEIVVWGGDTTSGSTNSGSRYRPHTNTWKTIGLQGSPTARAGHTAIWTGRDVVVWGGDTTTTSGGQYTP